jgi:Ca-activated chloride channel family protein
MSMQKLGTTLRRSRAPIRVVSGFLFLIAGLSLVCFGQAQGTAAQQPSASSSTQNATVPAQNAGNAQQEQLPPEALGPSTNPPPPPPVVEAPPTPAPNAGQPANGQPSGQAQGGQGRGPTATNEGIYVFTAEAREVILHATVIDERNRLVMDLTKPDFTVYENDQPQTIQLFKREDFPVAMGILVDNSGSMREKREEVNKAALNLVRSSNKDDQVFVVNFSDEPILDQDFTADIHKLQGALEHVEARGGTALYDAIVAACDHLTESKLQRKVLFVVTDGEDDASQESIEEAVHRVQQENGPVIYAIGLLGDEKSRKAKRALETFAQRTGGIAFFPPTLTDVDEISSSVAHDIRNQYTISYVPTTPKSAGGYRTIRVEARAPGHKKLTVRTRSGYYPGQEGTMK